MKKIKILSLSLGVMSLAFGALKFTDPFRGWYAVQIQMSGLPGAAYPLGIVAELLTGLLFLLPFLFSMGAEWKKLLLQLATVAMLLIMLGAMYVHLVPEVPGDVLPLKIKPPAIPLAVFLVAVYLLALLRKTPTEAFGKKEVDL